MKDKLKRIKEIEYQLSVIEDAYVQETKKLEASKGFDIYNSKWKRKIRAVADKYAEIIVNLQDEYSEIREYLNMQEELKRKSKFVDPSGK